MITGTSGIAGVHLAQHFHAVDAGHLEVGEHQVEVGRAQRGQAGFAVLARGDRIALALQHVREVGQCDRLVVDQEDVGFDSWVMSLGPGSQMEKRVPPPGGSRARCSPGAR
jgi:hypothetical protein